MQLQPIPNFAIHYHNQTLDLSNPHIMGILRHVAFNLLQLVKTDKISIRRLRKMCALCPSGERGVTR